MLWIARLVAVLGFIYTVAVLLQPDATSLGFQRGAFVLILGLVLLALTHDERGLLRVGNPLVYGCCLMIAIGFTTWKDFTAGFTGLSLRIGIVNILMLVLFCILVARANRSRRH